MEWKVVSVLIALVGLFLTVGAPIMKLNKAITTLTITAENVKERLDGQDERFEKQQEKAKESHEKLWAHNEQQDTKLVDHEFRIRKLEDDNV